MSECQASTLKRIFIGPYPVAIASPQLKRTHNVIQSLSRTFSEGSETSARSDNITDENLWRFVKEYAHHSDASRWDTELDPSLREELVNRLKRSAWLPNAKQRQETNWVGDTFEIGTDLLGRNLFAKDALSQVESTPGPSSKGKAPPSRPYASPAATDRSTSYVTAVSGPSHIVEGPVQIPQPENPSRNDSVPQPEAQNNSDPGSQQAKSDTFLLPPPPSGTFQAGPSSYSAADRDSETAPRSRVGLRSALRQTRPINSERSGDGPLSVNFADSEITEVQRDPAHPGEVLARTDTQGQLQRTSAGAAVEMRNTSKERIIMNGMSVYDVQNTAP